MDKATLPFDFFLAVVSLFTNPSDFIESVLNRKTIDERVKTRSLFSFFLLKLII